MESNFSFLASRAIVSPAIEAPTVTVPAQTPSGLGDFAEVLNGQALKAQRQTLADVLSDQGPKAQRQNLAAQDAPGQGLQVRPLGSKLNIITSDAPLPDMDSLAQFARMQGLDEGAVQALFGTPSLATGAAPGVGALSTLAIAAPQDLASTLAKTTLSPPSGIALNATANATVTLNDNLTASAAPPAVTVGAPLAPMPALADVEAVDPGLAPLSSAASDKDQSTAISPEAASGTAVTALNTLNFAVAPPSTVAPVTSPVIAPAISPVGAPASLSKLDLPAALGIKEISVALGAAPPALGMVPATPGIAAAAASATVALASSAAQTSLMPMTAKAWIGSAPVAPVDVNASLAPVAPQDAVRLTLAMPAPEITKRLAQMSGTGKEATWAALLASGPLAKDLPAAFETLSLELPAGFDPELLASATEASNPRPSDLLMQGGTATPLSGTANASAGSDSNADNAQAQADQRAQQFQQMADKMGQAAAQRLIAQIERGQWKMQMRMQPAALGSINVELDMHADGLDALFSTDNAVTRELMAQGSNKLRDTLTQAGMTVASVTVNGEQSRQSGGNSTPGKERKLPPEARRVGGLESASVAAPQGGPSAATDGLNVLA